MFTNTIDNKPIISVGEEQKVDLTASTFSSLAVSAYDVYRVPKDFCMRPDKISKAVYNTTDHTEIILKFNGISNPFSVNENDIIIIPTLYDALKNIIPSNTTANNDDKKIRDYYKFIDPDKVPTQSKENLNFDNRDLGTHLPPNIAEENESQITYRGGKIYFGDVNQLPCNVSQGMAVGDYLKNIIQNKI